MFTSPLPSVLATIFFLNDTANTEIYTLSLHDALPILLFDTNTKHWSSLAQGDQVGYNEWSHDGEYIYMRENRDRKSTRLNSSHANISYTVFYLLQTITSRSTCHIHTSLIHSRRPTLTS